MKEYNLAILGATGAVGQEFINLLNERDFPFKNLKQLASARSAGKELTVRGKTYKVEEAKADSFNGVDVALFAGGSISKTFAPIAVKAGAVVIDNSSTYRMDPDVPLIVPEVNPQDITKHHGIIANPNCATIIALVAAWPLQQAYGIRRMLVSTYPAVSGAGEGGMPGLLLDPPFILLVLAVLIAPEIALEKHLERRCPYARSISFVSDRRKITLDPAEISYVESNDSEVWIHPAGDLAYRTKTRISQWETQLDSRFLRIHRSFIVNTARIDRCCPAHVEIGGMTIEISRKYREAARRRLTAQAANA